MSESLGISICYLGTNCLFLQAGDTRLMIDPHFTRLPKRALLGKISADAGRIHKQLTSLGVMHLDAVLLTHTHYDHALDAFETAMQTHARLYGSASAVVLAQGAGLPEACTHQISHGEMIRIGEIEIEFSATTHLAFPVPLNSWLHLDENSTALRPPVHFWNYKTGDVYSMLLQYAGLRFYVMGSAGFCVDRQKQINADVAFLSIGGLGLQKKAYLQEWFDENVLRVGVQKIYLTHWDDFSRSLTPEPVRQPGVRKTLQRIERIARDFPEISVELLLPGTKLLY